MCFMNNGHKKVGIMGGTFNPIHNGHLRLAECALDSFSLDEVLFIPSGISWLKAGQDIPKSNIRCEMTALAIEGNSRFKMSRIEAQRQGNSYSYETILALKNQNPLQDYYFIMGADSLVNLEKWKCPDILLRECVILAAVREDVDRKLLEKQIDHLKDQFVCDIRLLSMPRFDISSTMIRRLVSEGRDIRDYVPRKVVQYIDEKHLYRQS